MSRIQRIDVPEDERRAIFAYLRRQDPGSKKCFDCANKAPTWASIHFGIYVCIDCSGRHRSMGTHITFVQSTDIDQWTVDNLRYMKFGGNTNATNALGNSDSGLRKYLDNSGNLLPLPSNYKDRLKGLVEKDRQMYPDRIYIEALSQGNSSTSAQAEEEDELDWLDSQIAGSSKPKASPKTVSTPTSKLISPTPATLPGIGAPGRTASASSNTSRTTTSSALLNSGTSTPGSRATSSSTLGAVKKTSSLGATKPASKLGAKKGLGATKAAGGSSAFEQAAKKAQEEEEKRLKEEESQKQREAEEKARAEEERKKAEEARRKAGIATPPTSTPISSTAGSSAKSKEKADNAEMERLGMGVRKLAFGAVAGGATAAAGSAAKKNIEEDNIKVARDRFGNQKAISSDMYFERNEYDPNTVSAAQTRLRDFQGATSISSNQYFGRPEDEDDGQGTSYNGGGGTYLTSDSLSGLESSARDAIQKMMSSQEMQNLGEGLRNAGLKLSDYLAQLSQER